jgi:hypothetical protein
MLRRYARPQTLLFLGLWLLLMLAGRSRFLRDPGPLWHIVVGEQILSHGELVHTDRFSCTRYGKPWIAQQWLGECGLALLNRLGKLDTVVLATATYFAAVYTWLGHRLLRQGMHPLLAVLVIALAVLASAYQFHPRPHVLNIALLGWTLTRLMDFEAGRISLGRLFWLIPLYALWTNIHGGMVGGVATIVAAAAGWGLAKGLGLETPLRSYRQLLPLAGLALACGLTALINPYGLQLPRVWFALLGSPLLPRIIEEHAPLPAAGPAAWGVVLFGLLYLAALLGVPFRRVRVTWLLPLLWLVQAWMRIRNGPLFVITAALAVAEMYPHIRWREWLAQRGSVTCRLQPIDPKPAAWPDWRPALLPSLVVLTALLLGRGWAQLDPDTTPIGLLHQLQRYQTAKGPGTPIFNEMLYGGFLIYYTPNLRVFIDDRCELYGDAFLAEYAEAMYHHPERIEEWASRYGFDHALVIPGGEFDRYLTRAGWEVQGRADGAVLYWRNPPPLAPRAVRGRESGGCRSARGTYWPAGPVALLGTVF